MQKLYPAEDKKVIIQMLKDMSEVLSELQVTWSLSAGALLGAVRSGKFIPWDYDIDICVHSFDKLQEIYDKMFERGYGGEIHQLETYGCAKFAKIGYKAIEMIPTVDMYLIDYHKPLKLWRPLYTGAQKAWPNWDFPDPHYVPFKTIEFEGMQLPCPANPEFLLERYYGKDWRVPDRSYGPEQNQMS